ncbi:MAG: HepT-like ribonuclease domain-containing protein [Algisphaera sp.]
MPRDARKLFFDIRHAVVNLIAFAGGKSAEQLDGDLVLRSAIERQLMIVGEAMARLRRDHPGSLDGISHAHQIIGMRNLLVHRYEVVEVETLAQVVNEQLKPLLVEVEEALGAD